MSTQPDTTHLTTHRDNLSNFKMHFHSQMAWFPITTDGVPGFSVTKWAVYLRV